MISKGDRIEININGVSTEGFGIGRADDFVVFVDGGLPGDVLDVRITKAKSRFAHGEILRVAQPSPHRISACCPVFAQCGGCQWQHCDYATQLAFKRQIVADALSRIGGIKNPPVAEVARMENPWNYRNKGVFIVQDGVVGMYETASHNLVVMEKCAIQHQSHASVLQAVRGKIKGSSGRLMARSSLSTGEIMATFNNEIIMGPEFIHEKIGHITYKLSAPSFFQVNTHQAKVLYDIALAQAALDGSQLVFDAHVGVGGIALYAAANSRNVVGIDINASAIADARQNAALNGIGNAEFICGAAEDVIPSRLAADKPDVIFLDPPRKGCGAMLLDAICAAEIPKIVYISCDAATLARDVKRLVLGGYQLIEARPVDMFPQTSGVEISCLLTRV